MKALRRLIASPSIGRSATAMAWVTITAVLFALLMMSLRVAPNIPFE